MNRSSFEEPAILLIPMVLVLIALSACSSASFSKPAQPQLPGSQWELASFGSAGEQVPVAPSAKPTLLFPEGDKLNGSGGCNSFGGTYTVDGNKIAVSRLASTLKACADPDLMAQEARYLAALQKASTYSIEKAGGTIRIDYDGNKGALNFVRPEHRP